MKTIARNKPVAAFRLPGALPLVTTLLFTTAVFGQDSNRGEQLAQQYRCYACHAMEQTLIGPPYQAIAARHASEKKVMEKVLATKIILGGGGNWGVIPMVPNEHVPEEDARTIASWILQQAP